MEKTAIAIDNTKVINRTTFDALVSESPVVEEEDKHLHDKEKTSVSEAAVPPSLQSFEPL